MQMAMLGKPRPRKPLPEPIRERTPSSVPYRRNCRGLSTSKRSFFRRF